jgi:uncharacterized ferritin-like protein (DUF455 family)
VAAASSLHAAALGCLRAADPDAKIAATQAAAAAWRAGVLSLEAPAPDVQTIPLPGRPSRPRLVHPRELAQRGLGTPEGRAALIHAVAHIELNAIDLAWDAVYRFRDMPCGFHDDWIDVACDEARHFALLSARLGEYGHAYGDFDAHNGLWDMAVRTAHSCMARMALVPRVLEARGLDVTPGMIVRLRECGDHDTAAILEIILREEVAHVAAGSRWFAWCCAREGVEPWPTFARLVREHASALLRPPYNREARLRAGFSEDELAMLEQPAG